MTLNSEGPGRNLRERSYSRMRAFRMVSIAFSSLEITSLNGMTRTEKGARKTHQEGNIFFYIQEAWVQYLASRDFPALLGSTLPSPSQHRSGAREISLGRVFTSNEANLGSISGIPYGPRGCQK